MNMNKTYLTITIWIIVLILYILSPLDLHPTFIDDLVALAGVIVLWNKRRKYKFNPSKQKSQQQTRQSGSPSQDNTGTTTSLKDAYNILKIDPRSSLEDIKKAYHKRMAENHPDKVAHLSPELQQRAAELTGLIQEAYERIKQNKK